MGRSRARKGGGLPRGEVDASGLLKKERDQVSPFNQTARSRWEKEAHNKRKVESN